MARDISLIDYILYLIVRFEAVIFRLLPLRLSLWLGCFAGGAIYSIIGKRKSVAYANLKAAFKGKYTDAQLTGFIRSEYKSIAQSYIELLKFPILGEGYIKKYIKIEGEEKLKAALQEGKGVIMLTAHLGNWELASLIGSVRGYKMNVLARWQKFERLNGYLNKMRSSKGASVIFKEDAREEIMRALGRNEVVGILSDQDGGPRGEFVDFFDRPASTPKGVAHFSLKTGAPILPVFLVREKGPYHRIVVEDDISVLPSGEIKKDIHTILQRFAYLLQSYVERYPGQWLWLHKRWKSTTKKRIVVLSDGKIGHLKQSKAVAAAIKTVRENRGRLPEDTAVEIIEVKFDALWKKAILDLGVLFGLDIHRLSFCFSKDCYDKIKAVYADYAISCGASVAGVNLLFKRELGAKSIVIMRPNLFDIRRYDLAIIPAHDRVRRHSNVFFTKGAVTGLTEESLAKYAGALKAGRVDISRDKVIGVLIGGDSKAYTFGPELIVTVLEEVLRAAEDIDADILITTSRRTSSAVESVIKERFAKMQRFKFILIAKEDNFEGAIEGIIGLSKVLVVSGESVAMVSEAVSSGKPVVVFMPSRKARSVTKQELVVKNLEKKGIIRIACAENLREAICDCVKRGLSGSGYNDDLRHAVERIL